MELSKHLDRKKKDPFMHRRFRNNNKKLLSSSQRCPTLTLHFKWCIYPRYRPHLQRSSQNGRGDFVPLRLTLCPGILVKTIQGLKTRQNTEAKNCRTSQRDKNVFQQKDFFGGCFCFSNSCLYQTEKHWVFLASLWRARETCTPARE